MDDQSDGNERAIATPRLLSGANPQIPKGDGDAPMQAYIEAMPGWKRDVGHTLDALILHTVPDVQKAVRWNSPFHGVEGQGWFLSFHCFTKYVKVTFFRGTSLHPQPPGESRVEGTRYLDIHEDEQLDGELVVEWITRAAELPSCWESATADLGAAVRDTDETRSAVKGVVNARVHRHPYPGR